MGQFHNLPQHSHPLLNHLSPSPSRLDHSLYLKALRTVSSKTRARVSSNASLCRFQLSHFVYCSFTKTALSPITVYKILPMVSKRVICLRPKLSILIGMVLHFLQINIAYSCDTIVSPNVWSHWLIENGDVTIENYKIMYINVPFKISDQC